MPAPSPLSIATQSVQRLVKEDSYYRKELAQQSERVKKLEADLKTSPESADGNAPFILKQEVRAPHPSIHPSILSLCSLAPLPVYCKCTLLPATHAFIQPALPLGRQTLVNCGCNLANGITAGLAKSRRRDPCRVRAAARAHRGGPAAAGGADSDGGERGRGRRRDHQGERGVEAGTRPRASCRVRDASAFAREEDSNARK